ncbi:MAG: thioredoxin-dependent peroxiredoxin [Chloroflexota bacterium]|nr:thioredoxin-dependent peroxiredoxin [Chloroflexota bacterium]
MPKLSEGDRAPHFVLTDQDGAAVSSDSFAGTPAVVYFYPADDTPGCTTEACQFNDNLQQFQEAGVPVVGVSPDAGESHVKFRNKYGLRFPLLSDPGHQTMAAYGAWGDRPGRGEGVIRSTVLLAPDGTVRKVWYGVKADGHAKEVLQALEG